jgi:hypothetical protein
MTVHEAQKEVRTAFPGDGVGQTASCLLGLTAGIALDPVLPVAMRRFRREPPD